MSAAQELNRIDEPTSALSLLDHASLSMALELLPHRALQVFRSFGLDGLTGPRAMASWETWLKNKPRESAEHAQMRSRMRSYWVRWDAQTPAPREVVAPQESFAPRTSEIRVVPQRIELSVMELASMSMALELLPTRRDEILASFGARTEIARRDAARALAEVLASSHLDVAQWQTMRARMRDHWTRWDAATPKSGPPRPKFRPRKSYQPPARFRSPPTEATTPPGEVSAAPQPSVLTLLDYVRLSLALERVSPDRAEPLYRQAGLDRDSGDREVLAWKRRLAQCDEDRARFHRLRDELLAASAPVRMPAQPPIGLFEYSVLCVELDLDPTHGEEIHRRLGLVDAASRDRAHAYWQGRFAIDEAARVEWFSHVDRLRRSTPARR